MAFLKFEPKDPEECLDYPIDFALWITDPSVLDVSPLPIVELDGVSTPGELTDLVIDLVTVFETFVTLWLSGGTHGETYLLKVTVTDDNAPERRVVRRVKIKVKRK